METPSSEFTPEDSGLPTTRRTLLTVGLVAFGAEVYALIIKPKIEALQREKLGKPGSKEGPNVGFPIKG